MDDESEAPGGIVCGGCGGRGAAATSVAALGPVAHNHVTTFTIEGGSCPQIPQWWRSQRHPSRHPVVRPSGWTSKGSFDAPALPVATMGSAYVLRKCKWCGGTGWL